MNDLREMTVTAPSRLHFGLLSFGRPNERQYGGVGVMIDSPGIAMHFRSADRFETRGIHAARATEVAKRWAEFYGLEQLPRCVIEIEHAAPQHCGLGLGTQLALSVAAGLHRWQGEPCPGPEQLARSVQRGLRSAIGVYGFLEGGLIVERGRLPDESLSPLDCRVHLPEEWRVVVCWPTGESGLSGTAECEAFRRLPAVPPETTARLVELLRNELLPSALAGDFDRFSESVYRYGYEAGLCYRTVQGGPFCSPRVAELVQYFRRNQASGTGQSSWGPTVFAFQPSAQRAEELVSRLRAEPGGKELTVAISRISAHGARIS